MFVNIKKVRRSFFRNKHGAAGHIINQEIDREIILNLLIDVDGAIQLTDTEGASTVFEAVEELETLLINAVAQLPLALPATKTNVGVKVKTSIKVPIRIIATPQV